ncbi:hypothetical protein [Angustibacter luteus]
MVKALLALIPSVGVLFLFVVAIKAMLEGDRRERTAQARWDKDHPAATTPTDPSISR